MEDWTYKQWISWQPHKLLHHGGMTEFSVFVMKAFKECLDKKHRLL